MNASNDLSPSQPLTKDRGQDWGDCREWVQGERAYDRDGLKNWLWGVEASDLECVPVKLVMLTGYALTPAHMSRCLHILDWESRRTSEGLLSSEKWATVFSANCITLNVSTYCYPHNFMDMAFVNTSIKRQHLWQCNTSRVPGCNKYIRPI